MIMYNENYHPLSGDNLRFLLMGLSEEEKAIVSEQVNAATAAKIRNYRVCLVPPDEKNKGGKWADIENGQIKGSCNLGEKK